MSGEAGSVSNSRLEFRNTTQQFAQSTPASCTPLRGDHAGVWGGAFGRLGASHLLPTFCAVPGWGIAGSLAVGLSQDVPDRDTGPSDLRRNLDETGVDVNHHGVGCETPRVDVDQVRGDADQGWPDVDALGSGVDDARGDVEHDGLDLDASDRVGHEARPVACSAGVDVDQLLVADVPSTRVLEKRVLDAWKHCRDGFQKVSLRVRVKEIHQGLEVIRGLWRLQFLLPGADFVVEVHDFLWEQQTPLRVKRAIPITQLFYSANVDANVTPLPSLYVKHQA